MILKKWPSRGWSRISAISCGCGTLTRDTMNCTLSSRVWSFPAARRSIPVLPVGRSILMYSATCTTIGRVGPDRTTRPAPACTHRNTPICTTPACCAGAKRLPRMTAPPPRKRFTTTCGPTSSKGLSATAKTCSRRLPEPAWKSTGRAKIT